MAASVQAIAAGEHVPTADHRVVMRVPWAHYEAFLALRGEEPVPRISYLDGAMELMTPSWDHERLKSYIGRLIEAYCLERDIEFTPVGSWTLRDALREAGVEPDECYVVNPAARKERPDLAIEVAWTSGGLDKLEIYRRLGVKEVVFWKDGRITIHRLTEQGYEPVTSSASFPGLDFDLLASFLDRPSASRAIRDFRAALGRRSRRPRR